MLLSVVSLWLGFRSLGGSFRTSSKMTVFTNNIPSSRNASIVGPGRSHNSPSCSRAPNRAASRTVCSCGTTLAAPIGMCLRSGYARPSTSPTVAYTRPTLLLRQLLIPLEQQRRGRRPTRRAWAGRAGRGAVELVVRVRQLLRHGERIVEIGEGTVRAELPSVEYGLRQRLDLLPLSAVHILRPIAPQTQQHAVRFRSMTAGAWVTSCAMSTGLSCG